MTEVWIVLFTAVVVADVVRLPRRAAVDGRLIEGDGALVQRAVLVELWRKIVHAALGFPAFALAAPPPLQSTRSVPDALQQYGNCSDINSVGDG